MAQLEGFEEEDTNSADELKTWLTRNKLGHLHSGFLEAGWDDLYVA